MASAAAGSVAAAVRTSANSAAVEGVAGASGAAPAALANDSNSWTCGSGKPSSSERFASTNVAGAPFGQRRRDRRQRHRELALDVPILLRVGSQLALGEGSGFPTTVKGVREQMTPDNRLCQHLMNPLSVHRRTLSCRGRATSGGPVLEAGHNRGVLSLVCFLVGGLLGWGAAQGGPTVATGLAGGPAGADSRHLRHPLVRCGLALDLGQRAGRARWRSPPACG